MEFRFYFTFNKNEEGKCILTTAVLTALIVILYVTARTDTRFNHGSAGQDSAKDIKLAADAIARLVKNASEQVSERLNIARVAEIAKQCLKHQSFAFGSMAVASWCLLKAWRIYSEIDSLSKDEPNLQGRAEVVSGRFQRLLEQLGRLLTNPTEADRAAWDLGIVQRDFDDAKTDLRHFNQTVLNLIEQFENEKFWSTVNGGVGSVGGLFSLLGGIYALLQSGVGRLFGSVAAVVGAASVVVSFINVKRCKDRISSLNALADSTIEKFSIEDIKNIIARLDVNA